MPVSGDVKEITFNNEDEGSGVFYPKAQEEGTYDYGGVRTADSEDMTDGGGRDIQQKQAKKWVWEGTITWDMLGQDELQILYNLAASGKPTEFTMEHRNGDIRQGRGTVVGEPQGNSQNGTISVKFSGGGKLEKVS